MNLLHKFKEYQLAKQGFIVEHKQQDCKQVLPNGKIIKKTNTVLILKKILPQAIEGGTLTIPDVDEISNRALIGVSNQNIVHISLPNGLKHIEQNGHTYPFAHFKNLLKIMVRGNNEKSDFFTIDNCLYKKIYQNELEKETHSPTAVELVNTFSNRYNFPAEQLANYKHIFLNNGAFAHCHALGTVSITVKPHQTFYVNLAKDDSFKHNYPNLIYVNGNQAISQSKFLLKGGRLLTEISAAANGRLYVTHIDCTDPLERFLNPNPKTDLLSFWSEKVKHK